MNLLVLQGEDATARQFRRAGHSVTVAEHETDVCALTTAGSFDAIVIGNLGTASGNLDVCHALRRGGVELPLVMIVVGDRVEARVEALDAGADDCVGVGCPADELLARLRALVRRRSVAH